MEEYTIAEEYELPSLGRVYDRQVNPNIKIRSMTTEEEMKRLGHSERPYKLLSEIMEDCLIEKPGIPVYDLCIGDYQFLLHRLRTVTYGADYKVSTVCPICGKVNEQSINLDELEVVKYSEELNKYLNLKLPKSGKQIELKLQTPRMLDDITLKTKNFQSKSSNESEPAILFTLISMIKSIDGEVYDAVKLESFIRHLNMQDTNFILQNIRKINIGVDTQLNLNCSGCGGNYVTSMPFTGEFFGPTVD